MIDIPEGLVALLEYNPDTGEVSWKNSNLPVACCTVSGYLQVRYEGRGYKLARVCYYMYYREQPRNVRHNNRNAGDFRAINLGPTE